MPKNRKTIKTPKGVYKLNTPRKLRIGTRSSGTSAHLMSTEDLKAVLNDTSKSKFHAKAGKVLTLRGVSFSWPTNLVKEASLVADLTGGQSSGASSAG